jgi:hypothetical protein
MKLRIGGLSLGFPVGDEDTTASTFVEVQGLEPGLAREILGGDPLLRHPVAEPMDGRVSLPLNREMDFKPG